MEISILLNDQILGIILCFSLMLKYFILPYSNTILILSLKQKFGHSS